MGGFSISPCALFSAQEWASHLLSAATSQSSDSGGRQQARGEVQGEVAGLGAPPGRATWPLPGFLLAPSGDASLGFIFLTPPLLPWTVPHAVLSWKDSRVSLGREKHFLTNHVLSKHWSLPPRLQEPSSFQSSRLDSSGPESSLAVPKLS